MAQDESGALRSHYGPIRTAAILTQLEPGCVLEKPSLQARAGIVQDGSRYLRRLIKAARNRDFTVPSGTCVRNTICECDSPS